MNGSEFETKLGELRREIDRLDAELLSIIGRRLKVSVAIGALKSQNRRPILDAQREDQMIQRRVDDARALDVPDRLIATVFTQLLSATREVVAARLNISSESSVQEQRS